MTDENHDPPAPSADEDEGDVSTDPIPHVDGQVLLLAAAKASVSADRLPDLVAAVQADLYCLLDDYRREYECVFEDDLRTVFLVTRDHWVEVGARLDLEERETDAVRRVHNEQLRRVGKRADRRDEFETALEIRDAVVIGR